MKPFILSASCVVLLAHAAAAQTATGWTGKGADINWSTAANWSAGAPPGVDTNTRSLLFGLDYETAGINGSTTANNDLTAYEGNQIIFEATSSGSAFTLTGNAFTLSALGGAFPRIENSSNVLQTFNLSGALTLNGGATGKAEINPRNGDIFFSNTTLLTLPAGTQLQVAGGVGRTVTFNGAISGAGSLALNSNSSVVSSAANTYSGGTTVNGGILRGTQSTGTPFGTGSIVANSGTLSVAPEGTGADVSLSAASDSGATFTYRGGTLALDKGANNSLTFTVGNSGAAANSVLVRGARGTLVLAPASGTGAANLGAATGERFLVNGGVAQVSVNGGADTMVSPTVFGQDNDVNKSGEFLAYSTTNGFVPATYGNTNFSGATTNTTVANVTAAQTVTASRAVFALKTSAAISLNTTQSLTIGNGSGQAGLILNGGTIQPGASQTGTSLAFGAAEGVIYTSGAHGTISTPVTGTGGVTKAGPGILTLSGANTFSNGLVLNGGSTRLTAANTISGGITINAGATLEANTAAADNAAFNNLFGAAGNSFIFNGGTFLGNSGADRLISGRTVTVGAEGATFEIVGNYPNFTEVSYTQVRLSNTSSSLLNGAGTVTKNGGGRLQFQNSSASFSGAVILNDGTLEAGGGSLGNASATNTVTINGGNLAVSGTVSQAITLNGGAMSTNGGNLTVAGAVNVTAPSYIFLNEFWRDFDTNNPNGILPRSTTINGKLSGSTNLGVAVNRTLWRSNTGSVILRNTANDFSGTFTVGKNLRLESNAASGTGNTLGTAAVILAGGGLNLRDNGATSGATLAYGNDVTVTAPTDIYNRGMIMGEAVIDVNRASGTNVNNTFRLGSLTVGAQPLTITGGNGYGVEFASPSTLTANATLNVNSAPLTFSGGLGEDAAGRGLAKNGAATLTFASNATYTGATEVNAGTLVIGGAAGRLTGTSMIQLANDAGLTIDNSSGNLADRLSDDASILMSGASLTLTSPTGSATNASETVGMVTLVDGLNTITATQGNSGAISALTLSSLVRQNQATVRFVGTNLGQLGNGSRIIIANQTTDIPFIPWATIDNDFAQYIASSESGFVRGVSAVSYVTDPSGDSGLSSSQNVKLVANDLTLTTDRMINSLNFANTVDGRALNVGSNELKLVNGGLLVVSNAATVNGTTGSLTSGTDDLVITNNAALNIGAIVKDGGSALDLTKAGPGTLTLSGLNTFTGDVAINEGALSISDVADIGVASNLGAGTALKLADTLAPVTLRFTGATDSTNRALSVFSGGSIVDVPTAATNLTWSGRVTSAGSFTKVGAGTFTTGGETFVAGSLAVTEGTVGFTGPSTTIWGDLNVGSNGTTAKITSAGGGTLSVGKGSESNINIGTEVVAASTNSSGTVDLSGLSSFTAYVNQIRIGSDIANGTPAGGVNTGSLILAENNDITATGGILVGDSLQDGGNPGIRNITFGSGTNTVITPVLTIGGRKYNATGSIAPGGTLNLRNTNGATPRTVLNVGANTGIGTGTEPVASFDLSNGTIIGSLFSVNVADRTGAGNNPGVGDATGSLTIGTNSANSLDISPTVGIALQVGHLDFASATAANVTPTSGTVGARSTGTVTINGGTHRVTGSSGTSGAAAVVLGNFTGTFGNLTPTITHSASGTLVINGGSLTVNSNGTFAAFDLGAISGGITGVNNTSAGTLTINGGFVTVNNQIQGHSTVAQSTSTLNLTGGTLNMAGKNITDINNLNFSGGTLRNVGSLNRGLDQTGDSSLLDVAGNNTTISGSYNVTDGDVTVAASRTLTVGGGMIAGGLSGTSNILINGTLSGNLTVNAGAVVKGGGITGPLTLAGGIIAPGNSPGILNTGNLTLSGGTLALELNGTTAGTGYDQISTTGTVSLTANTNFTLSLGFVPAIGSTFTLINNDGSDLVSLSNGALLSFNGGPGIADGTTFTTSQGYEFRLNYNGGSGNDIVLVTTVPEPGSAVMLLAGVGSLLGLRRFRRSAV